MFHHNSQQTDLQLFRNNTQKMRCSVPCMFWKCSWILKRSLYLLTNFTICFSAINVNLINVNLTEKWYQTILVYQLISGKQFSAYKHKCSWLTDNFFLCTYLACLSSDQWHQRKPYHHLTPVCALNLLHQLSLHTAKWQLHGYGHCWGQQAVQCMYYKRMKWHMRHLQWMHQCL